MCEDGDDRPLRARLRRERNARRAEYAGCGAKKCTHDVQCVAIQRCARGRRRGRTFQRAFPLVGSALLSFVSGALTDQRIASNAAVSDFAGRVAIVTGAARGLGRAAAERLYERGAAVAVNVRDTARAESLASSLGERALAVAGDIAADGVPEDIVRRTLDRFGRVDILVNNAAFAR